MTLFTHGDSVKLYSPTRTRIGRKYAAPSNSGDGRARFFELAFFALRTGHFAQGEFPARSFGFDKIVQNNAAPFDLEGGVKQFGPGGEDLIGGVGRARFGSLNNFMFTSRP